MEKLSLLGIMKKKRVRKLSKAKLLILKKRLKGKKRLIAGKSSIMIMMK
jgi:hypothetical protein